MSCTPDESGQMRGHHNAGPGPHTKFPGPNPPVHSGPTFLMGVSCPSRCLVDFFSLLANQAQGSVLLPQPWVLRCLQVLPVPRGVRFQRQGPLRTTRPSHRLLTFLGSPPSDGRFLLYPWAERHRPKQWASPCLVDFHFTLISRMICGVS